MSASQPSDRPTEHSLLVGVGGWHRVVGDVLLVAGTLGTVATGLGAFAHRRRKAPK